jgi:hypothetical protein
MNGRLTTLAFTGEGPCTRISGVHENMPSPSSTCNALLGRLGTCTTKCSRKGGDK